MESNQDFGSLLNNSSGSIPAPSGGGFGDLLSERPADKPKRPASAAPIDDVTVASIADREGLTPTQRQVMTALLAQESGSGRNTATSVDGARGAGQIIPATFSRYAKPGESIDNTEHNLAVMARIVKDAGGKFGDDPAKIATAYFSGDGNVNPGQGSAWKNDAADGNGKRVSGYVSDVMGRLGGAKTAESSLPDLAKIPKWGEISKGQKFMALPDADKQALKAKYFDEVIAPHAKASGANLDQVRQQFLARQQQAERTDRTWGEAAADTGVQLAEGVNTIMGAVPNLLAPEGDTAKFFNDNAQFWRDKQSDPIKGRIAQADQAISKAGEDGVIAQVAEAAGQYFSDPVLAARFVTTNLPSMIPGIGAAKLTQAAALARGATAAKAASAATTAAGGVNAVLNAGGARGEAFEDIKRTLIAQGMSPQEAEQKAIEDSRVVAAVGGAAGFISGKIGLEKALVGGAGKGGVKAGGGAFTKELAGEQIEEVTPQLTTNFQAGKYDNRSIGKDVGRTIVETAIGSAPGAVVAGAGTALSKGGQESPVVTPDGRIEPSMTDSTVTAPAQPEAQPVQQPPAQTVQQAPAQTVSATNAEPIAEPSVGDDAEILEFAQSRVDLLQSKLAGEGDGPDATGTLTPTEQDELAQLEAAGEDTAKLRRIYGFDQPQPENQNVQEQATAAQDGSGRPAQEVTAPEASGQQEQVTESEADREARLEREAIQGEGEIKTEAQDDADIPFDFAPPKTEKEAKERRNGTEATQAQQAEAQGQEAPAAEPVNEPWVDTFEVPTENGAVQVEVSFAYKPENFKQTYGRDGAIMNFKLSGPGVVGDMRKLVTGAPIEGATDPDTIRQAITEYLAQQAKIYKPKPKTEKEAKAQKADGKWFGTQEKADGYIAKNGLANTHEVVKNGAKFEIKAKSSQPAQPVDTGEGAGATQPTQVAPKTEKEATQQRDEFTDAMEAARAELPEGFSIQAERNSISLMQDGKYAVNGLNRNPAGIQEAVRQAKLRAKPQEEPQPDPDAERKAKAKADLDAALGDLGDLLGKGTRLNIVPEEEQKLLPILTRVMDAAFRMGYYKFKEAARFVLATIRERLGDEAADQITLDHLQGSYIGMAGKYQAEGTASSKREVIEVESLDDLTDEPAPKVEETSTEPVTEAADLYTPEGKFKIAQTLADEFIGGASFKTIIEARKRIGELIGKKIEAATELAKQADEAIEVAVVLAGREIVKAGRAQKRSPQVIYDRLVDLYNRQPNLAVRSSTSVRDQAYSTPVPLAFVASELAGVTYDTKALESTAGNGMLMIGADMGNATVNELNPKRAAMLRKIGFDPTTKNAATETLAPAKSQGAVVINPPFGVTKDANGETIIYEVKPNFGTREVDHAIVFKTLEALKDDGRAVLIVGGTNAQNEEGRREDYRGKGKRTFYFNLYGEYNVVDHFTVDGSLYSKQGASYPVDVIVIEGRGKSSRDLPAADLPKMIGSYDELKEKLNGTRSVGTEGVQRPSGTAGSQDQTGGGDRTGVAGSPVGSDQRTGDQRGRADNGPGMPGTKRTDGGGTVSSGPVAGAAQPRTDAGTGPQSDRKESVSNDGGRVQPGSEGRTGTESDGLGGPSVVTGERVESGLNDRRGKEQETENQVEYTPHSTASSVGTLVPRAMRDAIDASLQKIEDQVGSLDEYVAERLAMDPDTVQSNFSAEQIDALALAIKNAEEGRGFIIGDQTGIGKGRVVAAMIRYALVNDKTPIFVTEKPNLYADMIRDLDDIGMTEQLGLDTKNPRILMTNSKDNIPYVLLRTVNGEVTETNLTLKPPKRDKELNKLFKQMMDSESLGEYKVIFTTYNQLQTVKGAITDRMKLVQQFGAGNYVIFDESHNAGGGGETQARTKEQREQAKEGESLVTGRASFARQMVGAAYGTFFSSATYAKRPDVMDLYSSTNMKLAVDKISQLGEAIKNGGVPMQQVVANMLTMDGQYIRRERTFAGVSYDTVETKVDKQTAENMASAMRSVLAFSRAKDAVIKNIQKEMDKEGATVREMGGVKSTIEGANFGSIMHNLIDQMLLSLKAQDSVRHAIERLKSGEKVVLTVSNTMGSFIKDYSEEMGLNMGDPLALSFGDLYQRYLEKQRYVTIKDGAGKITKRRLSDQELGPKLVEMFNNIAEQIRGFGFGSAPISPIDYLHDELNKAGYKTDEITGRTIKINYASGTPILASRNADIKQRLAAISGFNNGSIDVLILNQSGSTGLSLHSNSKFKDQRKRHMIVVQAEKNIDTHMQMLGRVHRTGQVIAPAYSQMMADVPAEMRPAAVLLKKMASLNANTTASRKSSVTAEGVVDFMNDYGGQVVHEYLRDNPEAHEAIGGKQVITLLEDASEADEEAIRKFTGYIPILPIKQQEEIYKDLIDRYNELLERENSMGTNKLEAKAVDLDAETVSSQQITEDKGDPSIFASPANMERVDVKRTVKPFSKKEVEEQFEERLGSQSAYQVAKAQQQELQERAIKFAQERIAKMQAAEDADPVKIEAQKNLLNMIWQNTKAMLDTYYIGSAVSVKDKLGQIVYGVITDIKPAKRTANPAAGSDWKMQIALANGDAKTLNLTFSQIGSKYTLANEDRIQWFNSETQQTESMRVIDIFDKGATSRREKRWMVTGNILAGYAKYPGQIITYTRKDGTTAQGVLMSRQFDFEKEQKNQPVRLKTSMQAIKFIDDFQGTVGTEDGSLRVLRQGSTYNVIVPSSKKEGGTYFLDQQLVAITGDFYKRGGFMVARMYYADDAMKAIEYIMTGRQEPIVALTHVEKAKAMLGEDKGVRLADFKRSPSISFAGVPEVKRVAAGQKLTKLEAKLDAGKITESEFILAVREINRDLTDQRDERKYKEATTGRRRGADWIIAQLRRGVADNTVPRGEAEFAEWLLGQNPNIANDLGYSISHKDGGNARGDYTSMTKVMRLFSANLDENGGTAVHEMLHHTERMMPPEVQEAILREWQRAWDATFKKATPALKKAMMDMLEASMGSKDAEGRVGKAFGTGTLNYDQHYQLYSPSEFWAVNATRILSGRYEAKGSWVQRAIQWFKELIQRVKGVLGLRSDAPMLKALNRLMKGEGAFVSEQMLMQKDYSVWLNEKDVEQQQTDMPVRDIIAKTQRDATQFFGNRENLRTFGWYDRSLSTQFNKALKDEHYGKVFAFVNAMQNEVSLTSIRPAELAPGILRKVDDFGSAVKTLVLGPDRNKSLQGATKALIAGTLSGKSVLEGKVHTDDELRNNFGLDDAGVALYKQARAAIDASLDEIAAAEAYAMAQGYIPKQSRRLIIDNPQKANRVIFSAISKAKKLLQTALDNAIAQDASPEKIESLEASIKGYEDTEEKVKAIFAKARDLKAAGYAPLMRFGKYHVGVEQIDPSTGTTLRDDNGEPVTMSYQMFETMAEASEAKRKLELEYAGQEVRVYAGPHSNEAYKLYDGISPETLALFAEEVGADKVLKQYYKNALSERSALKRRLERKNVAGYSEDLPRILSNFVTSNGRFAAQRYYMRDLNNAIKYIPKKEKGDVLDEAIKLREHIMNPNDPAAPASAAMFAWFLGGSLASAMVNLTQPVLMTAPYLSQFGVGTATKAIANALPMALGKKQIADADLRKALKRASQEGIVEAQEIFHLYSQGAQGVSAKLANSLSKMPLVGNKLKSGTEGVRARSEAFFSLWGMMFSAAESFNRKLTFMAAWEVAIKNNDKNPYAFAVRAVNETQGIYNKANRPNWARGPVGRVVLTFKQFSLMYVELLKRMWGKGGPEGKRAAAMMLAMLMLAAGEEGLPFAQDLDDLIDTIGQWMGYDTNAKRTKRRLAYEILGENMGDLFLYGASSMMPLDFSGRLGLGNLIPGTGLLKQSAEGNKLREVTEVVGPSGSLIQQLNDAYEAANAGNTRKAFENAAPKAVKDVMSGAKMATSGYATDTKGRKNMDVTIADAAIKSVGFNPTKLAEASRARGPGMQDRAMQKNVESSIVDTWARGIALNDPDLMKQAETKLKEWNAKNPDTPVAVTNEQIRAAARQYLTDQNTRIMKSTPRELRGRIGLDLAN